jgi:dTMP kinase
MISRVAAGIFITFEGLDGAGKSTQLQKLAEALRARGLDVVATREPGGTAFGEKIRQLLLDSRSRPDPSAELVLMFAARAQHVREVIEPALRAGKIVLSDRFTDSSEAYQGGGRELGSAPVRELHRIVCGNLQPQLTILLDTDAAASVARARRRNNSRPASPPAADESRFERENRAFFERVRKAYLAIAAREPARVAVVNSRRPIETVHREIVNIVRERIGILAGPQVESRSIARRRR